ncbi:hypothetical protein F0Q45_19880 [Mycobacterium simiae]|uniref:Alpha/beta hydrolase n=1 Tax=Mycobacterium simiae TaxID=1784 RepID=A0A5B1BJL0_MYCSI|nr:alpha/beta hydrolase [Mycobacterium simiae]KAA1248566.1 hypothetical protein F0Q45_19880 [Mycobacterium simiae]
MRLHYISIPLLVAEAGGDPWQVNATLQHGRPADISALAQAFDRAGQSANNADAAFAMARSRFAASWTRANGDHPINDCAQVRRVIQTLRAQAAQLPKIAADLSTVAAALTQAQSNAGHQIAYLETQLQDIDSRLGQLLELERSTPDQALLDQYIADLEQQAIDDTATTLHQVKQVRANYAAVLGDSRANLALDVPLSPPKPEVPLEFPPPDTDPEVVKRWWDSLSQEQRDQLIAQHPPELGNLNGINAIARDAVNQAVMNDDINRVEDLAQQRGVSAADVLNNPATYRLSAADITRYQNAIRTRDGLSYNKGPDGPNERPVMLWSYDPLAFDGQGKAAIAIGNPDWARNTAVIVPGTGSSVAQGWMSGHDDAINLYDQARAADPEHHYTSVIAWMGYDAPDGFSDTRVSQPGLARQGGDLLARDVNGLWATHNSLTPQHISVIGHSYGSTTVADAFAGSGMRANDAVLIGSPGTDLAHSAADFHLDGGHVYVGAAATDPVSWIGQSSGVPGELLKDRLHDYGIPLPANAGLGRDPAGEGYGSIRFQAEVPGSGSLDRHDHSHYYVMGSEALRSMTDIAVGQPHRLATEDLLADGRRQPHLGAFRIPGIPGYIDPEAERPRETIRDDHQYPAHP